jgi:ABC-type polysaccharide/polyol phosphate transport system ATPase subunit
MSAPLLRLPGVGKDYAKLDTDAARVKLVLDLLRRRSVAHAFRALDDVSFDLAAGKSLGIFGDNGAGKSTLLKIVAGVITPTRGSVDLRGRVGALLELGSGFHPEYSGLANIGEHIHGPIKHYSSGMGCSTTSNSRSSSKARPASWVSCASATAGTAALRTDADGATGIAIDALRS